MPFSARRVTARQCGRRVGASQGAWANVAGLVIPVPEEERDAYRQWAEMSARFFREYGCLEIVECWEDSFPAASSPTSAEPSRQQPARRSCCWQVWRDKVSFTATEERMHQDPQMDEAGEPPFDAKRLILGCFQPIFTMAGEFEGAQ